MELTVLLLVELQVLVQTLFVLQLHKHWHRLTDDSRHTHGLVLLHESHHIQSKLDKTTHLTFLTANAYVCHTTQPITLHVYIIQLCVHVQSLLSPRIRLIR